MSATIHGFSIAQLEPQPDFRASKSETGEWTATQTFWHRKGSFGQSAIQAKIREGTRIYTLDPNYDTYFSFLKVSAIKDIDTQDGGWAKISLEFKGFPQGAVAKVDADNPFADQDASSSATTQFNPATEAEVVYPTYHLRGTVEEASIFTHKKFTDLTATEKHVLRELSNGSQKMLYDGSIGNEVVMPDGSIVFAPLEVSGSPITLTGDALSFAQRILEGRTTWKTASFEWVRKWTSSQPVAAVELNKLGKICATPPGPAPTAGADRNWLFRDVNQEQTGSVEFPSYQCEAVFLLSPIGGFDSFLQT